MRLLEAGFTEDVVSTSTSQGKNNPPLCTLCTSGTETVLAPTVMVKGAEELGKDWSQLSSYCPDNSFLYFKSFISSLLGLLAKIKCKSFISTLK